MSSFDRMSIHISDKSDLIVYFKILLPKVYNQDCNERRYLVSL